MELGLDAFARDRRVLHVAVTFQANGNERGRSGAVSYRHRIADWAKAVRVLRDLERALPNISLVVPMRNLHTRHRQYGEREHQRETTSSERHVLHLLLR